MPRKPKEAAPDLSSVRTLITSVAPLARHLGVTTNAIYRWFKVNRIPGEHIIKVANFYNVEIRDLLPLTGSDLENEVTLKLKSRETLPVLLKVRAGEMTIAQASEQLGQHENGLKLILVHWGDELPTLYRTLEALDKKEVSLDDACKTLGLKKYTIHGIRRKYGYAPGHPKSTKPEPTIGKRRATNKALALQVIAGKASCKEASDQSGVSERTIFRAIEKLSDVKLNELAHWPRSLREAYAVEIEQNLPKYAQKWLDFAENARLVLKKSPKYPQTPKNWKDQPLKRLLVGVLMGEASLAEIAAARGADPAILASLFTSDLRNLDVTYDEIAGLPLVHQVAVAEILLAILDRKRRLPEGVV